MPLGFLGSQGDNDTYRIERSLRFNSADSAYLNRTPASAGNRKTWTWSGWVKVGALSTERFFLSNTDTSGYNGMYFGLRIPNILEIGDYGVGSWEWLLITSALFRDTSAWYHIVASIDTTQATASNRAKLYVNGNQITSFSTATYPSQNADLRVNSTSPFSIGRVNNNSYFYDGYLTEIHFIDGQALTPSSFGETDAITGRWKAKAYSGTYGTNGFYLKFADNSGTTSTTLGKDSSPNGNNWTPNNFSVTAGTGNDSLVDSPTNYGSDTGVGGQVRGNYATWNPIEAGGNGTFSDGNLLATAANSSGNPVRSTISFPITGKWYCEITGVSVGANATGVGIISNTSKSRDSGTYYYQANGQKAISGSASSYGSSWTNNDIIGIALDEDAGTLVMYKNNVSQGTLASGITGQYDLSIAGGGGSTIQCYANFGQRPFAYTAPTGFKALCTTNLPTPTIKKPSSYMDVLTYTGNGSASQDITSLSFSPDLVWLKSRTDAYDHRLKDSTRGNFGLFSNLTNAESAYSLDFLSNGIRPTLGFNDNISSKQYVAWAWDESPIAGMDIVSYTGTGAIRTVAHDLGVAPKMIIAKLRNSAGFQWPVYHSSLTSASSYIWLNSTNAQATDAAYWGTAPTSSVFSVGTNANVNNNTSPYIAYCFAEVEGFSKFGSYTGNASADGPFIYCGFRPKLIIGKRIDAVENWIIYDTSRDSFNVASAQLQPNTSIAETTANALIDFNSNGFKFRSTNSFNGNSAGGTHIFAAFAESPFKYARAR